jgi:hypothetical protein
VFTINLKEGLTARRYGELQRFADQEAKAAARAHVKQQREEEVNRMPCLSCWSAWVDVPDDWVQRKCGWNGWLQRSRWHKLYCDKLRQERLRMMHDVLRVGVQGQLVKMANMKRR